MTRAAVLSLHTSPLVTAGRGDAGGMNVYVRELVSSLAQTGVDATVFVRRWNSAARDVVDVEPGFRVVHVPAGPVDLPKEALPEVVDDFAAGVADWLTDSPADVLHANYWLSGVAGHRLKHELDLPMVSTFHTLARVKASTGDLEPEARVEAEAAVIACSDAITASSAAEARQLVRLYRADPRRVNIVAPGVDRAFFSVGARRGARSALGLGDEPVLLFVGRIQPLKGVIVAVEVLAALSHEHPDARLLVVGGASGVSVQPVGRRRHEGGGAPGRGGGVRRAAPPPHHLLSTYYRAADVCLVPRRSESFGVGALEAAAGGIPVVAADGGGLRTLVEDGRTGFRITGRSPARYADAVRAILGDPALADSMTRHAAENAGRYTWTATSARLRGILDDLASRTPARVPAACAI